MGQCSDGVIVGATTFSAGKSARQNKKAEDRVSRGDRVRYIELSTNVGIKQGQAHR